MRFLFVRDRRKEFIVYLTMNLMRLSSNMINPINELWKKKDILVAGNR